MSANIRRTIVLCEEDSQELLRAHHGLRGPYGCSQHSQRERRDQPESRPD